ncbi:MAG: DUF6447 family protein, partial [Cyanobacteriota bacterium]|nr:DUF6447 family protein [Cyanobacteriota bacterium]
MAPKWPLGRSKSTNDTQEQNSNAMTDSAANKSDPVLTFEGKRYDLNALPDELKEL